VYSLVWLGRWLERADSLFRLLEISALLEGERPEDAVEHRDQLRMLAQGWNFSYDGTSRLSVRVLESAHSSVQWALDNANQVGSLEIIRNLNELLAAIDGVLRDRRDLVAAAGRLSLQLSQAGQAVEERWFHPASVQ
jgi:uncharacterized alpha-E superfamily protein